MKIQLKRVGKLTQAAEELPFRPKRAYWIMTEGGDRGNHAHKRTQQVFICIQGRFMFVIDDGKKETWHVLHADIPEGIWVTTEWHRMVYCSKDCIILVIASEFNDENDKIRDYEQWKEWLNGNRRNASAIPQIISA